jgi:hypothetical protein
MTPDARGWIWSPVLHLWIGRWEGIYRRDQTTWLRFYDPADRLVLTSGEIAEAALQQAEVTKQRAETVQQRAEIAEQRAEAERVRAAASEAELARLRAELARLRGEKH